MPQTILRLTGSNHKRIKVVDITPDPDKSVVTIGGKNSQGKTSVMDLLPWAFAGRRSLSDRPVRDGERKAEVMVETEDYVIERSIDKRGRTKDTVFGKADGAQIKAPQSLLSKLYSDFTFDALAFSRMAPRDQRSMLVKLAGVEMDDIESEIKQKQEAARVATDRHGMAWSQLSGMGQPDFDEDAKPVSVSDLMEKLQQLQEANAICEANKIRLEEGKARVASLNQRIKDLQDEVQDQQDGNEQIAGAIGTPVDTSELVDEIDKATSANASISESKDFYRKKVEVRELDEAMEQAKDALKEAKATKVEALRLANLPIDGLGFDEDGVSFNGIPFDQLGSAEQLRVSVAMAMALNPELHVIRIMDGSLLDSDSMKIIEELAGEKDYQVWIEVVDEDGNSQITIEDGKIK